MCSEKTGGLEQSLRQTGRAWHGPKWSDPQAPQSGGWGLLLHPSANDLLWQSTGWTTSRAGEPGLPSLRIALHLPFPFSAVASASCSLRCRASTKCHAFLLKCCLFSFLLFPHLPPVLKTHQAPFLSVPEQSSCPVRQGGRAEGILGGLCLPARDLRNQTNKSPREHRDKQTRFYISPSAQNTAMHLSSLLCEDQRGISSLAGRGGTVLLSL